MDFKLTAAVGAGLVALGLVAIYPAAAAHETGISGCIQAETGAKRDGHGCIGRMAGDCASKPEGQSTPGEARCNQEEADAWDAVLNKEYGQLLGLLKPEAAEDLRKAQRIWITSRDADCRVPYYFYNGGTIVQILGARCLLDRTAERALLIHAWHQMARSEDAVQ